MWSYQAATRIDYRVLPIIFILMMISLITISSYTGNTSFANSLLINHLDHDLDQEEFSDTLQHTERSFFTPQVKRQMESFALGLLVFFFLAGFDYHQLRKWSLLLYFLMLLSLFGLFLTDPIQRVQRWYKIPFIGMSLQPSEYAKLILVITLSWFLEKNQSSAKSLSTAFFASIIAFIPFILILKQPDLGTALILFPMTLVMFYFGNIRAGVIKFMSFLALFALLIVGLIFSHTISHEEIRPIATKFLKDYQFDRLDPNTHHQKAAVTALAVGGITGSGYKKAEFAGNGFLPEPFTDSVFPAFGEEFGLIGDLFVLLLYYALLFFSFQVTAVAKDQFGRLLSAGITVYLGMHILVNIGMMCGCLPITGVPLVLITYGGSSTLATLIALGLLQSVYSRRFMF